MSKRYEGTSLAQKLLGVVCVVAAIVGLVGLFHLVVMGSAPANDPAVVALEKLARTMAVVGAFAVALGCGLSVPCLERSKYLRDSRRSPGNTISSFFQWLFHNRRQCERCQGPKKYGQLQYLDWEDSDRPHTSFVAYYCPKCDVPDDNYRIDAWDEEMVQRHEFEKNVVFLERL